MLEARLFIGTLNLINPKMYSEDVYMLLIQDWTQV